MPNLSELPNAMPQELYDLLPKVTVLRHETAYRYIKNSLPRDTLLSMANVLGRWTDLMDVISGKEALGDVLLAMIAAGKITTEGTLLRIHSDAFPE